VRVQSIEEADDLAGRSCDLHLVLRGLEPVRRTTGQVHVLWIISHPEALDVAECDEADLVLVASTRFAAHLRERTDTPVEVLLQATDATHFAPRSPDPRHRHPLTVVANSRGVARGSVSDALAAGLRPAIYGTGWHGLTDPALVVGEYVSFEELPLVYSSADVVLNDHWETMRRWGFCSNRIFDVLATGTTVVSDHLPEISELFDDLVPTWRDPDELRAVVDALQADPEATQERTRDARSRVLDRHTFDHRVVELHQALDRHGLVQPGARS
jgi:glycosyltransferase involved in cell wall biosynthesis